MQLCQRSGSTKPWKTRNATATLATTQPDRAPSADAGYVAGVDIGGTNLRLALADRTGVIVAKWSSSTAGVRGADCSC